MVHASSLRIAVLGGGVMGGTLISVLVASGVGSVVVAENNPERAQHLADEYGVDLADAVGAVRGADLIFVVVKPADVAPLVRQIAPAVRADAVVASFAAGVRCSAIEAALPSGATVIRVMPNTPALVKLGMFGVSAGTHAAPAQVQLVVDLLADAGDVAVVAEVDQDALTAVSGSGPAYVFYLAEQMIAAGVAEGLDASTARQLTVQTIQGAAALLSSSDEEPAELRRKVTSPNGTTHAAITTFDSEGVAQALQSGVRAAAARSRELSGGEM
jgi:pyrroline-5-carboxylate reductase